MNRNTFKTFVLLTVLGGLFIFIGGGFWGGAGAAIGLVIALVFVGGSYWFSDKVAVKAARAEEVDEHTAPELYRMVRELATQADMPMPRLYISPMEQPNAFATGRNPDHAAVCVTQGIRRILEPEELRGVLAHELAHVKNRDVLIGSIAAVIAMAIMFSARMAMFGAMFGGRGGGDRNNNAIGLLALAILAPIAAMLLRSAISRSREYDADRSGAGLIGTGEPLARALEKMETSARRIPADVNPAQASMYIVNPLSGRKVNFARLFSTHPPTEDRIARLRGHA